MITFGLYNFGVKMLTEKLPGVSILFVANFAIFVAPGLYLIFTNTSVKETLLTPQVWLLGLLAGTSFVLLYSAIEIGAASIIFPIYGLYMIIPTFLGIYYLGEEITLVKAVGIAFAIAAVILLWK